MKVMTRIFWSLFVFCLAMVPLYGIWNNWAELAGPIALLLTAFMMALAGWYLGVTEKKFTNAPEDDPAQWELVAGEPADPATLADLAFAWRACRSVKSNAILLANGGASVGVGMGQVNRVDSCKLAVERAGERARGCVAASDAFFPFADGPALLIEAGVAAIVQPGGSVRDADTIAAAQAAGVTMYFTGTRHFFH